MRKVVSIFFLTLYLTSVFSSLLPYIEYLVNYNYIANELCVNKDNPEMHCNGKCHLKKELEKTVKTATPIENDNENPVVVVSNDENFALLNKYKVWVSAPLFELENNYKHINTLLSNDIYHNIFHPPQFV